MEPDVYSYPDIQSLSIRTKEEPGRDNVASVEQLPSSIQQPATQSPNIKEEQGDLPFKFLKTQATVKHEIGDNLSRKAPRRAKRVRRSKKHSDNLDPQKGVHANGAVHLTPQASQDWPCGKPPKAPRLRPTSISRRYDSYRPDATEINMNNRSATQVEMLLKQLETYSKDRLPAQLPQTERELIFFAYSQSIAAEDELLGELHDLRTQRHELRKHNFELDDRRAEYANLSISDEDPARPDVVHDLLLILSQIAEISLIFEAGSWREHQILKRKEKHMRELYGIPRGKDFSTIESLEELTECPLVVELMNLRYAFVVANEGADDTRRFRFHAEESEEFLRMLGRQPIKTVEQALKLHAPRLGEMLSGTRTSLVI